MSNKQHPLTKAELTSELKSFLKQFTLSLGKKIDALKLDKRLDKIDTKIDLTFIEFEELLLLVKHHQEKIKELEERINELSEQRKL